ncbi:MAG: hypothetical protein IPI49_19010 [Myxococcales bacterium]|nr:hypothetical protein [Myxococcales bacterium]
MDLRFDNHPGFHRATLAMVALGAGLSALAIPLASRLHIAPTLLGGVMGLALGAGVAHGGLRWRAALGALACVPVALSATWGALAVSALLVGLTLALGTGSRQRTAVAVAIGAGAALLASWASVRIFYAQETASWGVLLRGLSGGAAMGLLGALATLPRHVAWELDAVAAAARTLPGKLDGEVRQLCERSVALWGTAKVRLVDDASSKDLLRSGVLKVLEVARRAAEGMSSLPHTSEQELAQRIAELDSRVEAATDAETKAQYVAAREALDDQRKYRDRLRAGRERMVARLHNHVAALEKFHLAAVSMEASKKLSADEPMVKQLAELSSEVSASGDALVELAS